MDIEKLEYFCLVVATAIAALFTMINIGRVVGTEITALTTALKIKLSTYVRFFILYVRNPFKNKIAHILSRRDRG